MQAKEPFVSYVAEPSVLTVKVLHQDSITANFNKMRAEAAERGFLSDEEIKAEICAARKDIAKRNKVF